MRIGIDATAMPVELYGAGNYIFHLIQTLLRVDTENEYVVFTKSIHTPIFRTFRRAQLVPLSFSSRLFRVAWEQTVLPVLVRQHRLDLLHSPHYTMPVWRTCRSVVTFHDMTFYLYPEMHLLSKRLFFGAMISLSARRADALIAISVSTRADTIRLLKTKPEKIFTVPYGIDPSFHSMVDPSALNEIRARYHLPQKFILYVGNLEPRKNLPTLLRAFARVIEKDGAWNLVMAGSRGWKDAKVFSTVKELGLADRVSFPGFIPQFDLPVVYSLASVFVYSSLYEGFGLPVLEAMACGVPVITSNISSMPEIVGGAGILVDPHNEVELAEAMQRVLTDRALHDKLARDGRERSKQFSWERTARETLAIYKRVAQRR